MSTPTLQGTDPPTKRNLRSRKRQPRYTEVPSDVDEELIDAYNDLEINPSAHRKPESTKKNTTKAHSKPNQHNKRKRSNKKTVKKDPSYIGHIKEAKLFKKESPLEHLDLKLMIPTWINQLPQEQLTQLLTLLPAADKWDENTLDPDFLASSNRILWDAVQQWEDTLLSGGFSQNKIQSPLNEAARFKDENYERYWGERLEKKQTTKSGPRRKRRSVNKE